jgi:hypothetical protein
MQAGGVKFEGDGPFYLRAVESANASVLENTIQLTLYAWVDEPAQKLVRIETQMTARTAEQFATHLSRAASEAAGS